MLIILYALEVMKYCVAYDVCFQQRVKRYWLALVGGLGCIPVMVFGRPDEISLQRILMYLITLCVVFLMMRDKWTKKLLQLLILLFILSSIEESMGMLLELFKISKDIKISADVEYLIPSALNLLLFILLAYARRRLQEGYIDRIKAFLKKNVLAAALMMATGMLFTVAGLNYARRYVDNPKFHLLVIGCCAVSYMSICLLGVCAIYLKRTNEKTEQMMQNEILLKDMQKRYYAALLEREEDTRKYRHDMVNHLLFLKNLADDREWSELQEYLYKLQGEMDYIANKCYATGDKILDVMTNYYTSLLPAIVAVKVSGRAEVSIDEMKLCTIYANLLQNAVEELLRIRGNKPASLEISFKRGEKFFQITIKNSMAEEETGSNRNETVTFETKKNDKRNHGIGLQNVKKAVEELEGTLEIKKEQEYFKVIVTLKVEN